MTLSQYGPLPDVSRMGSFYRVHNTTVYLHAVAAEKLVIEQRNKHKADSIASIRNYADRPSLLRSLLFFRPHPRLTDAEVEFRYYEVWGFITEQFAAKLVVLSNLIAVCNATNRVGDGYLLINAYESALLRLTPIDGGETDTDDEVSE
jgi:hypothetical protein